jgi:hypothetical protein
LPAISQDTDPITKRTANGGSLIIYSFIRASRPAFNKKIKIFKYLPIIQDVQTTAFRTHFAKRTRAWGILTGIAGIPMKADRIKITRIRSAFFSPVLGPLVRNRRVTVVLAIVTAVQVLLAKTASVAWQCPVKSTLGVECPACGLTRAMVLFAQGHWKAAIDLHAFAPLFLCAGFFLVVSSILPARFQQKIADQIEAFERHSGIVGLLMLSILTYWILRIINLI